MSTVGEKRWIMSKKKEYKSYTEGETANEENRVTEESVEQQKNASR